MTPPLGKASPAPRRVTLAKDGPEVPGGPSRLGDPGGGIPGRPGGAPIGLVGGCITGKPLTLNIAPSLYQLSNIGR